MSSSILFLALPFSLAIAVAATGASGAALQQEAKAFVTELSRGQSEAAARRFDATVAAALPPPTLAATWAQIEAQAGPFQGIGATREEATGPFTTVFVRCRFAAAELDAKIVYSKDGKIAGLFFVPPTQAPKAWAPPPYASAAKIREESVTVGTAWPLGGTLTLPAAAGAKTKVPAVVLVHGSGPHDRDETIGPNKPFADLAFGLASRGIAVLRYEKRTKVHGERLAKEVPAFTLNDETVDDAVAAVELLALRPEIDASRIFVAGHSLGGMAAPRIAERSKRTAGIVILAGNTRSLGDAVVDQLTYLRAPAAQIDGAKKFRDLAASPSLKASDSVDLLGAKLPGSYLLDLRAYDPAKTAAALSVPVLVLQGGRDYQVTVAKDLPAWKAALAAKKNASVRVLPSLNHLFLAGEGASTPAEYEVPGHVDASVIDAVAAWILTGR